jgi:hypothetical protein
MNHPTAALQMPPKVAIREYWASIDLDEGPVEQAGENLSVEIRGAPYISAAAGEPRLVGGPDLGRTDVLSSLRVKEVPSTPVLENVNQKRFAPVVGPHKPVYVVRGSGAFICAPIEQTRLIVGTGATADVGHLLDLLYLLASIYLGLGGGLKAWETI